MVPESFIADLGVCHMELGAGGVFLVRARWADRSGWISRRQRANWRTVASR
jgi:hypothetical protein